PDTTDPEVGQPLQVFQDDIVFSNGQPIAVVVAETIEQATHAAGLVRVKYHEDQAVTEFSQAAKHAFEPTKAEGKEKSSADYTRGDLAGALRASDVRVSESYLLAAEHHNPMEPHATVAAWNGDQLTL